VKISDKAGTRVFLRDEQGAEAYYNFALTPWALLTPNVQVVRPTQKRRLTDGEEVNTATAVGLRLQMVF